MEIIVGRGRGFKTAEEKDRVNYGLGTIVIDSAYSPVKDVGYDVEYTRVGDITNYEKLIINIETDGTITPMEAVSQANQILMDHFNIIAESTNIAAENSVAATQDAVVEETPAEVAEEAVEEKAVKKTRKKKNKQD